MVLAAAESQYPDPLVEPPRSAAEVFNVNEVMEPAAARRLSSEASSRHGLTIAELHAAYNGPHFPWLCGGLPGGVTNPGHAAGGEP